MKLPGYAKHATSLSRGIEMFNLRGLLFREINRRLQQGKKVKLLEIGCGKGILLLQLLKKFPKHLELHGLNLDKHYGVRNRTDFKNNALDNGLVLPEECILPYIHFGNATHMQFDDSTFDIVISQVTFIHIANKAKAIEETHRVLRKEGIALLSLGPYSIRRERNHAMSLFYKNLNKKLDRDYNPRFLIKSGTQFVSLSSFMSEINRRHSIRLWTNTFVSSTQRARGFWFIIRKNNAHTLKLMLRYNKKISRRFTKMYSKSNPANFGFIDVYEKNS